MDAFSFHNQVTRDCEWFAPGVIGPQNFMLEVRPSAALPNFRYRKPAEAGWIAALDQLSNNRVAKAC